MTSGEIASAGEAKAGTEVPSSTGASGVRTAPIARSRLRRIRVEPLPVTEILVRSFRIYIRNFPVLTLLGFIVYLPLMAITCLRIELSPFAESSLTAILYLLLLGALIHGIIGFQKKRRIDPARCLDIALRRLPSLLCASIVSVIICILLAAVPALLIWFIIGCATDAVIEGEQVVKLIKLSVYIPALMVYSALYLAPAHVVVENAGPLGAISRSQELTKGNRGRIFAVIALFALLNFVIDHASASVVSGFESGRDVPVKLLFQVMTMMVETAGAVAMTLVYRRLKTGTGQPAGADRAP